MKYILLLLVILYIYNRAYDNKYLHTKYKQSLAFNQPTELLPNIKDDLDNLNYPLMFKISSKCHGFGYEVQRINNKYEAEEYIKSTKFPLNNYIAQKFIPFDKEITVYFKNNKIESIYNKYKETPTKRAVYSDLQDDQKHYYKTLSRFLIPNMKKLYPYNLDSRIDVLVYKDTFYVAEVNSPDHTLHDEVKTDKGLPPYFGVKYFFRMFKKGLINTFNNPLPSSNSLNEIECILYSKDFTSLLQ